MYLKKSVCRRISAVMALTLALWNSMSAAAAPDLQGREGERTRTVETAAYRAELDLGQGKVLLSCSSDKAKDWNTDDGMSPGTTVFLDSDNQVRQADMTVESAFDNLNGDGGVAGIRMTGELAGVKSWFLFDSEVVCLGAGIENNGESTDKIINVVDNVPVSSSLKLGLTNPDNGYRGVVAATKDGGKWPSARDTVTQQKHTRNCLTASTLTGSNNPLEWHYIFGDTLTNSQVYCRFPTTDGTTVARFELWTEPVKGMYQYTLGTGGFQGNFGNNTMETENKVLSNTRDLQAAEVMSQGLMAVNKWAAGEVTLPGQVADITMNQPVSVFIRKSEAGDRASITLSKISTGTASAVDVAVKMKVASVDSVSNQEAVTQAEVEDGTVFLTLNTAVLTSPVTVDVLLDGPQYIAGEALTLVRGDVVNLKKPEELSGQVTWSAKFLKKDGTYLRNVGSSKIKKELQEGQTDGTRKAGDTLADHLITVKPLSNGDVTLTAKEKGSVVVVAVDESGNEKVYPTEILYENPDNLPQAASSDYKKIRQTWKESLIGTDLASEEGGAEILEAIDREAGEAWNSYYYKGQDSCEDIPWDSNSASVGNPDIEFKDDAVEFRPAFKNVLAMAKAYSTAGSSYYKNQDMLRDMIHIMDYLCGTCYTSKSQTDNWWTWEIGMPKDLIPILILLYDDLTREQVMAYTEGLYFFQPDPFHEGAVGTGSTHAQGYRTAQGANIIDCSTTAVGLGALREDNEQVYLGMLASSETFVIQEVEDSTSLSLTGYTSGFYSDGSYLDHSYVPYIGAYGIEFMKGGVKIPSLIGGTPWQYPDQVQKNLEYYIVEGFGNSMYRGMMLDCLKGRSVSRPGSSNRAAGREAMAIILQMVDTLSPEAKETVLSSMKYWLEEDPGFIDSLKGVENMAIKRKAQEILDDDSIESYVPSMHRSFPLMDRAVHRRDEYLFALAMYSERIQNTEIMNDENKFGWHQGNGMTYIYDDDNQYTDNYWNTVNPLRLPGTTVVPMDIGNGKPDSSNFLQGGDFCSRESWVGGSSIDEYGISGMSFSGEMGSKGKSAADGEVSYAPNLRGKKSWFMFDDEIVCLGAGITNQGMDLPVETTVENRKLGEGGDNRLTVDGTAVELPVKEADVKEFVDGTADMTGTSMEDVIWAHLEGTDTRGVGYYFPYENTQLQVRRARTTGNWKDVGTSEGENTENYIEMWFDHGVNPENASYGYVLLPGKSADETADYADSPEVVVLMNNAQAQAVYHEKLGITGINFWENQELSVGDVTCDKKASVMLREDSDGVLEVAVSDPTMKNRGTINVTIDRPVDSELSLDGNVSCKILDDNSAVLTFQMKGTNGGTSVARLQLKASILPSAAGMKPGESRGFEVVEHTDDMGEITWSVMGGNTSLAAGTAIDDSGVLEVDEKEENTALVVTAKTASGYTLNAYVSLGGDVVSAGLPEDMKKVEEKIQDALQAVEEMGADDPEAEEAVTSAITAAEKADSSRLAEYMMNSLLKLAQLYIEVRSEMGTQVEERLEVNGNSVRALNPFAAGMVLNISPSYQKTSSTAVLVISGEDGEAAASLISATPSNASRKAVSAAPKTESVKATPSVAEKDDEILLSRPETSFFDEAKVFENGFSGREVTKINGKEIDQESICRLMLQLFWEKEDEETSDLKQKIPYMVTIDLPESIDEEISILASVTDGQGTEYPLSFKLDREERKLTFFPVTAGTVVLANEKVNQQPGQPEDPGTEEPKPERPEDPGTENPKPEKPEDPGTENPKPEKPGTENPKPGKPGNSQNSYGGYDDSDDSDSGNGWSKVGGHWRYRRADGRYAANCWEMIGQQWYSFDARGNMRTGWYLDGQDGFWYYLKPDGAMAVGWIEIGGIWYYLNVSPATASGWSYENGSWKFKAVESLGMPRGALYQSRMTPDGYQVDEQGRWIQ